MQRLDTFGHKKNNPADCYWAGRFRAFRGLMFNISPDFLPGWLEDFGYNFKHVDGYGYDIKAGV